MSKYTDTSLSVPFISRREIGMLVGLFALWRTFLFFVGYLAQSLIEYKPSFPYADVILIPSRLPQWLYSWANFDGVHYITIAEKGYVGTGLIQAFFPFFPALILRPLYQLFGDNINLIAVGLLITNLAAAVMLLVWFAFLKSLFDVKRAWLGVALLLLFPTSFFMGALYTESIFFLSVISAFYAAKKEKWVLVSIFGIIATSTRVVGIFLIPALLIELWIQWREKQTALKLRESIPVQVQIWVHQQWRQILLILLGSLGLLGYMAYLGKTFGDPLYFLHVQSEFGAGRTEGFVVYPQVLWRSIKILLTVRPDTIAFYTSLLEFLAGSLGLLGLLYAALKVRLSYVLFALGAFFMPTFTGTFSSMPRYILVCFPLYFILIQALHSRPRLRLLVLVGCAIVVVINTVLFVQGYWVS